MINCIRCANLGFCEFGVSKSKFNVMRMWCACEFGRMLKDISIEIRLNDLVILADNIVPRLEEVRKNLSVPSEALKNLDELIDDITTMVRKTASVFAEEKHDEKLSNQETGWVY